MQIIKEDLLSADLSFKSTISALLEGVRVREVAREERTILLDPGFSSLALPTFGAGLILHGWVCLCIVGC